MKKRRIGILCGGGPAPGFNGVISSVTLEAQENDCEVLGFVEGFKYLQRDAPLEESEHYYNLASEQVSRIIYKGGSIIRTSRANPIGWDSKDPDKGFHNCLRNLEDLGVTLLVTIGGDDTSTSANRLHEISKGSIKIVHVPKTIDNDLPLPSNCVTFGFRTAVDFGTKIVQNLMTDAETYARYFVVVSMGRHAGHLALAIGKGSSAHLTVVAEEFTEKPCCMEHVSFKTICDIIEGTILKRRTQGRDHGVIVLAEGLMTSMKVEELVGIFGEDNIDRDSFGQVKLDLLDLGEMVVKELKKRMGMRKIKTAITSKKLGYEVRCQNPTAFDRIYTRDLGYFAVKTLLAEDRRGGVIIYISDGLGKTIPFERVPKDKTGHTVIRKLNIRSEYFEVARAYMIRLKRKDFLESEKYKERMEKMLKVGNFKDVEEYKKYFKDVMDMEYILADDTKKRNIVKKK